MPSPFPGMDPYIEAADEWGDFHTSLLAAVRAKLNAVLPHRYRAKLDLFVFIHEPSPRRRRRYLEPDVYVVERARSRPTEAATVAGSPSATITLPPIRKKHKSVLIVDRQLDRVVTAIKVLSPSNKEAGDDRTAYLQKRGEYLASRLNLVELDLLRGGPRLPLGKSVPAIPDYYIMVCRAWEFPHADVWALTIRDPLPGIPIPLAEDIPDAVLPLRACIDRAYDEGCYDTELDHESALTPRPSKADAAWTRNLLAGRKN
jgi:hypothetical protein